MGEIMKLFEIEDNCEKEILEGIYQISRCFKVSSESLQEKKDAYAVLPERASYLFNMLKINKYLGTLAVGLFQNNFEVKKNL